MKVKFGDITARQAKELCEKYGECRECPILISCAQVFGSKVPCTFQEDELETEIDLPDEDDK